MLRTKSLVFCLLFVASNVIAECFILSTDGTTASEDRLCIDSSGEGLYNLSLNTQSEDKNIKFGQFENLSILNRDQNSVSYGTTLKNSIFTSFSVLINYKDKTISIGESELFFVEVY